MTSRDPDKLKIGVIQLAPFFLNNQETLKKVDTVLQSLRDQGVEFALFPESTLPGYPRGLDFGTKVGSRSEEGRNLWLQYHKASILIGDETFQKLANIISRHKISVAIGVTERDKTNSSLYCSLWYFSADGHLEHVHRKVKPTGSERVIWAEGNGSSIRSVHYSWGRVGGLICWENYMPEVRMKLYHSGIDLYCAPTADARDSWLPSMRHIACEARSYVISANQYVSRSSYPVDILQWMDDTLPEVLCRGGSCVVSPYGEVLGGPLWDREDTLICSISKNEIIKSRMDFDPIGHYRRTDI